MATEYYNPLTSHREAAIAFRTPEEPGVTVYITRSAIVTRQVSEPRSDIRLLEVPYSEFLDVFTNRQMHSSLSDLCDVAVDWSMTHHVRDNSPVKMA